MKIIRKNIIRLLNKKKTLADILDHNSKLYPKVVFIVDKCSDELKEYSYEKFNDLVDKCCCYFSEQQILNNQKICLVMDNSIDYLILYFAALRSNIILNPLPATLGKESILKRIKEVNPKVVFYNCNIKFSLKNILLRNINNFENGFTNFLEKNYKKKKFLRSVNKNSLAILYYSSGTTGKSKIIEYPHSAMLNTQVSLISSNFYRDKNCHLCFLPLSHTSALTYTVAYILCVGGKVILCKSFWNIKDNIWDLVQYYRVNYFQNVPTTIKSLLNINYKNVNNKTKTIDFLGCGSATLSKELLVSFEKKFKIKVSNLYGLSEAGPTHFDDVYDKKRKIGSIGKLLPLINGQLFDEKKNILSFGRIGEFGVKSKNLLLKYYNDKNFFKNYKYKSYFLTGDYLRKDKNGYYYFVDRKKDIIIKGGVNVVPSEIENVIKKSNMVKDVCVVALQDEFYGEDIGCFVIKNKNFVLKKILHMCEENLGSFKTPVKFRFINKFPMNLTGKILKSHLRLLINSK